MTQSQVNTAQSSITPDPLEPLGFAFGTPEVIRPLWNRMCKDQKRSGLHVVGLQTKRETLFQIPNATIVSHRYGDRSGEAPVNLRGESGRCGRTTAIPSVPPDPWDPLAISIGTHGAITDRAIVDEIIQRHSSADLADGPGLVGQLRATYILGISAEYIDAVGASASVTYSLLPSRVTRQPDINESPTAKCPARLRAKHAVDVQIAILGSLLHRRSDLYWIFESLMGLSDSLAELDAGFSPPVLTRTPRSANVGREDTYQRVVKSVAVIAWQALIRTGVKKGDAKRLIVNFLTKGKFLPPKKQDQSSASTRSISNWRKRYEAGDLPPLILVSRRFLELFPAESKSNLKAVLKLARMNLMQAKAIRDAGGGLGLLRPADLQGSGGKPSPVSI